MMIPEWIWRLPFMQRERVKIFAAAQKDMEESLADDIEKRAEELSREKLARLLSVVDDRLIVSFSRDARAIYIGGERVEESKLANLRAEAEAITAMEIWKLIFETPKELAMRAMFLAGDSIDEMKKGRSILYTLDTQKRILDTFKSYTPSPK